MEKEPNICKDTFGLKVNSNIKTLTVNNLPNSKIKLLLTSKERTSNDTPKMKDLNKPDKVYYQRKSMLPAYQALFGALWDIPDKDVQKRVLNAINDDKSKTFKTIATQTDITMPVIRTTIRTGTALQNLCDQNNGSSQLVNKRKRKKHIVMPQVSKESHTGKASFPIKIERKAQIKSNIKNPSNNETKNISKRSRLDSFSYLLPDTFRDINCDEFLNLEWFDTNHNTKENLYMDMIREHIIAPIVMDNGLLPIHETIVDNNLIRLRRQIYIWQDVKRINLNDLITNEEEDCLQLALANNSMPLIINVLLLKGLNANSIDNYGNTVIHLAVIHDNEVLSLHYLLKHIDMKLLLNLNDDGYTPLHLAAKYKRYILAEYILNTLDEIHLNRRHYDRCITSENDNLDKGNMYNEEDEVVEYYKEICLNLKVELCEEDVEPLSYIKNSTLKTDLLNARDMRTGSTAIYIAMENKLESLIYLLLAHLSDPLVENFSGQNAKTYYNEFGRTLGLSIDIDKSIDKTVKLLEIINTNIKN